MKKHNKSLENHINYLKEGLSRAHKLQHKFKDPTWFESYIRETQVKIDHLEQELRKKNDRGKH